MRRFVVFLVVVIGLFVSPSVGQQPVAPPSPDKPAAKSSDYSQEAYVVESYRTSYRFENDGTGVRELRARIKVQSEAGVEQWGQLVFGYNSANEKVDIPYVRVLKADGSTVSAPEDSVQDLSAPIEREAPVYTDYRQKHITVPGLRPGEELEYDIVSTIHTPLGPGQFWMEHTFLKNEIVLDEQLELNVPRDRRLEVKNQPGFEPKITEVSGRKIYLWNSSHRVREDEAGEKKKARKEPEPPSVQMTTFANWEDLGRWYAGLEKDRRQPTDEIRKKAAELTAGKTTDLDKISALYDFVATNFRYISLSFGVGRYQPHSASDVLHNQYGDCKDKHTLLAALLEASGYHASSVLINSNRKLDVFVPSPSQFDHVISLVPLAKEEVWMDTTTEVAPFRLLSPSLRKKEALVVPANGTPHLEETPADPPMHNIQIQDLDGKVNELGKLDLHVKVTVRGDMELFMRLLFRRIPNAQWQQLLKRSSSLGGLDGEVSNLKVGDPAATKNPFVIEYDISAPNFLDWAKKKSDVALPLSTITLTEVNESELVSDPIQLGSPAEYSYHLRLQFPAKYSERVPLPFSMKRDYAEYEASYKAEGNVFTGERRLVTSVRELPPTRNNDYLAFRRAVLADVAQHLSVDSSAAGTPAAAANLKGDDLNDAARAALDRGDFQSAIDLLKRLLDSDPKHKNAWVSLGRAYMGQHKTEQAIEAFRKQADLDPYDEYAYGNLGWAYSTARNYEQAEAAYKKALEINPLSNYAHGALAGMYVEQKKYDAAVPEFEKAASLTPENPVIQVNLGQAYLNLGQDEKALAAFDRAVDLSATPVVWNDIAYDLTLRNSHLERAQQYAESAVAATVAASRNVALDQLNPRDLGTTSSLAAYWDTLGWVYFTKNDLAKAEKYLAAAWALDQHSDIGDHLGQLYQKQGRRDDAIRVYAMALAAMRPEPEARTHLAALVGGGKVDATVDRYRDELQKMRTVSLGRVAKETASADFFILLANAGGAPSVQGVKFVNGEEKLKIFSEALRSAKFNQPFPDDAPTQIVRRGTLSCSQATGECGFVLLLPSDVASVN
ncbi:MAG TPA: DUF3857 domain-containing protein [Terriglobales bacterium]|nr:DUF3857 domain-containing protein [Terriglobales bacterium]